MFTNREIRDAKKDNFKAFVTVLLAGALNFWLLPSAQALKDFSPQDVSILSNSLIEELIRTSALVSDHYAQASATPLGTVIGLELGAQARVIKIGEDFKTALVFATGVSGSEVPTAIGLPKFYFRKGLPLGLDFGFSFFHYRSGGATLFSSYGGDIQWAPITRRSKQSSVGPFAFAVRLSQSFSKLFFIRTQVTSADVIFSKDLVFVDPYVGVGVQFWQGKLDVPVTVPKGSVDLTKSGTGLRLLAGLPMNLGIFKMVPEVQYGFDYGYNYGLRFVFSF